ncbi:hypothetical protein HFE03_03370 [Paenibacillus sp. EKM102P]|uniref:hypothetical protein n=1 Tax=unclassified Paenibacillus TaxID=185978 RepID=UPI00142DFDAB|nr:MULTISPECIES: hypothetical protein [unclassified Paenibacillus]KAF6618250.1 hypothetical protein HFE00_09210 [Paenibacillus sp. EKM101P]KAF6624595.1 hypothetical protein HFE03_03370 [Paenibacillus sp. EKM102P]KAF6635626.1 hypothetical protein HFE01_01660 [Paenibacillus sp. EKM10P]KAF6648664.1 hypothetical protein HFE02_09890 [Paenibacillus sp. EKM11P]
MKVVPKVNIDGLYIEVVEVDDAFSGVVPFYAQPDNTDQDEGAEPKKPELVGYTVGVPITTPGLYKPKFDLAAWKTYESAVYEAQEAYISALDDWQAKGRAEGEQPVYVAPKQPNKLWIEGLTPEQIAELTKPATPEQSETDLLRQRLSDLELVLTEIMLGK